MSDNFCVYETANEDETIRVAAELAQTLRAGDVVAFLGGLGAGKTTFVRGLAQGLAVTDAVSSPTFALVHEYRAPIPLVHFDMYRIDSYDTLESTGFFDYMNSHAILAVEWSENITAHLPSDAIFVTITAIDEHTRKITINRGKP